MTGSCYGRCAAILLSVTQTHAAHAHAIRSTRKRTRTRTNLSCAHTHCYATHDAPRCVLPHNPAHHIARQTAHGTRHIRTSLPCRSQYHLRALGPPTNQHVSVLKSWCANFGFPGALQVTGAAIGLMDGMIEAGAPGAFAPDDDDDDDY